MAETELQNAFNTLADAFTYTENEIREEVKVVEQEIEELKQKLKDISVQQETLAHDRKAIEDMYNRYQSE